MDLEAGRLEVDRQMIDAAFDVLHVIVRSTMRGGEGSAARLTPDVRHSTAARENDKRPH